MCLVRLLHLFCLRSNSSLQVVLMPVVIRLFPSHLPNRLLNIPSLPSVSLVCLPQMFCFRFVSLFSGYLQGCCDWAVPFFPSLIVSY